MRSSARRSKCLAAFRASSRALETGLGRIQLPRVESWGVPLLRWNYMENSWKLSPVWPSKFHVDPFSSQVFSDFSGQISLNWSQNKPNLENFSTAEVSTARSSGGWRSDSIIPGLWRWWRSLGTTHGFLSYGTTPKSSILDWDVLFTIHFGGPSILEVPLSQETEKSIDANPTSLEGSTSALSKDMF